MLTLNLNLLYTVVNVLVLFLLLRKFLYKPVMNIIAQRQKQVDDALAAAETSKKEAATTLNTAQDKLRNVDAEAAARRAAYEEQAEKEKQQLLADAQKQADAIVAEGKRNAEAERQHKLREADAQTTALAREMCEKLLARNLTQQDDARLLDDLLPVSYTHLGVHPDQQAAEDQDTAHRQHNAQDGCNGQRGVHGNLGILPILGPQVLGHHDAGTHGHALAEADEQEDGRAAGANGCQSVAAQEIAHDDGIGRIVQLLEQVAQNQRHSKQQQVFKDAALGHQPCLFARRSGSLWHDVLLTLKDRQYF